MDNGFNAQKSRILGYAVERVFGDVDAIRELLSNESNVTEIIEVSGTSVRYRFMDYMNIHHDGVKPYRY